MRRTIGLLSLAVLAGVAANAADSTLFSLRKAQFKDWTPQGEIQKVVGQKLYDLIDGFADIHMGFYYIDSEHMKLKRDKKELEVNVYRVKDSDDAYGLYSALHQRDGELIALTDEASYSTGTLIAWRGPYTIEVKDVGEQPSSKDEMSAVAKTVADMMEGKHQPPELVRALPKEKLVYRGVLYFRNRHPLDQIWFMGTDNVLLLGNDITSPTKVEAVYATYSLPDGDQGLLVIRYPEIETAKKALGLYTESVRNDMATIEDKAPFEILTAKNGKQTLAFQKDRVLILGLETTQAGPVKSIVEAIAKNLEPKKEGEGKK